MRESWIVAQLGAREHYVIPRTLYERGQLSALLTDAWVPPHHLLNQIPLDALRPLQERYHDSLADAPVHAHTWSLLWFEIQARLRGRTGWTRMMKRNQWFERKICADVMRHDLLAPSPVVFAYSYAAHDLFVEAKKHGAFCVLGQIDAGPHEADLVDEEHERYPAYGHAQVRAPASYWNRWRRECALADDIVVNSAWSKKALAKAGIAGDHIQVVPLAYSPDTICEEVPTYPEQFTAERPLRVLYLGTLTLRKGLARLVETAALLQDAPITFEVVGGGALDLPDKARQRPNIKWVGRVPRGEVHRYYANADVFLFPTLSDGFGLTQLEAMAAGLPVIASNRCGDVVTHDVNGLRLDSLNPPYIADVLRTCTRYSERLERWAANAPETLSAYHPDRVIGQLQEAVRSVRV